MRRIAFVALLAHVGGVPASFGQDLPGAVAEQLRELTAQVTLMRQELAAAREESAGLRRDLDDVRRQLAVPPVAAAELQEKLAEDHQLLAAKVEDQYQSKVGSGSRYRVTLSGMALLNLVSSRGAVDSLDLPAYARGREPGESNGAFGASMRQTILGLDVTGPTLFGARTRGEIRTDFYGTLPGVQGGETTSFLRLRTAKLELDWQNHSLLVGQDVPFMSPNSPTSIASTAYPALWSAGNLWAWTPQVRMTHRIHTGDRTRLLIQYGLLDPLTGEVPPDEYRRIPTAGESTRTPALAARIGLQREGGDRNASAGFGTYYSRQNWGFDRRVNAWAVTADWDLPVHRYFSFSGELYRGRAIGGLGGGTGSTLLRNGPLTSPATAIRPVESEGGWGQLKFKPVQRWEFNAALGGDFPFRLPAAGFGPVFNEPALRPRRNTNAFWNVIYQPRTNLLFSVEYRRLWSLELDDARRRAGHVSVGAGVLF